jgi:hypothetical protein
LISTLGSAASVTIAAISLTNPSALAAGYCAAVASILQPMVTALTLLLSPSRAPEMLNCFL